MFKLKNSLKQDASRLKILAEGQVVPDANRCVQCGICSFNCPLGINVRRRAWRSEPINEARCLSCGECVSRCPRGALRFQKTNLFTI